MRGLIGFCAKGLDGDDGWGCRGIMNKVDIVTKLESLDIYKD